MHDAIHIDETIETILEKGMNLRVTKADPLNPDDFVLITERVAEDLRQKTKGYEDKAAASALAILLAAKWSQLTPIAILHAIERAAEKLDIGAKVAQEAGVVLSGRAERIVQGTKESLDTLLGTHTAADWRKVDQSTANFSRRFQRNYIQEEYRRRAIGFAEKARSIVTRGLETGRPLDEIQGLLAQAVESFGLKRSNAYWSLISTEFANRARVTTQLNAFEDAGIEEYLWDSVLDERTCFAAGTKIRMANGEERPIELVQVGDLVVSSMGRPKKVVHTEQHSARQLRIIVRSDGHMMRVTANHPILTVDGWVKAGNLVIGDQLVRDYYDSHTFFSVDERRYYSPFRDPELDGLHPIPNITKLRQGAHCARVDLILPDHTSTQVYDFEVEDDHGYIAEGVIVHNTDYCRAMHGTVIPVSSGRALLNKAMFSDDPEAIKEILPWVRERRLPNGEREMYVRQAMGDRSIGIITRSGVGFRDVKGEYRNFASLATLESIGIILPPAHGFCRSTIIPVLR